MDYAIMNFVQQNLHTAFTDVFFPIVTMLGNHGLVWLCLIAALLLTKKYRRCGGMLLLTLAATFLLGEFILKPIIARPRPFVDNPNVLLLIPPPSGYSCPSNHSSSSFAVATMLCFYHKKAGIAALVLAFLIAFSRIFLFVHYPTDVIFGAILGILCSVLLYKGSQAWQHKYSKNTFSRLVYTDCFYIYEKYIQYAVFFLQNRFLLNVNSTFSSSIRHKIYHPI